MNEACHTMAHGEILNEQHTEYPLFEGLVQAEEITQAFETLLKDNNAE